MLTSKQTALDEELAKIGATDIAMNWVSYPGRTSGTATALEIDFATPAGVRR